MRQVVISKQVWTVVDASSTKGKNSYVPVVLSYDSDDPYAVSIDFGVVGSQTWVIARSLLHAGRYSPHGEGDVYVKPSSRRGRTEVTTRGFDENDEPMWVCFSAETALLTDFLVRSHRVVPSGTESDHMDMDAVVTALLADAE